MKQKNRKRMKRIMACFLLIAMMFTFQNMTVSAVEVSGKDVPGNEDDCQLQSFGEIVSNYSSRVSIGSAHISAITENGDLYCWGDDLCGQVGNNTWLYQLTPIKILSNATFASMGKEHSSAITENGDLYCWGESNLGQVGNGTHARQRIPAKILSDVIFASMGDEHSSAITTNGELYCWGWNRDGQVGNGTREDQLTPTKVLSNATFASMGNNHSSAITENGDLYCWGSNYDGQVGNGTKEDQLTPTKVLSDVVFASMGGWHSSAITTNGELYCWGSNYNGQVGNGTREDQLTPTKVLSDVVFASIGDWHSSAITTNGDLYCWGNNYGGQVGNGTKEDQLTPTKILSDVVFASMGDDHSSAITTNGDLYCWGANGNGQVGNGTKEDQLTPTKILSDVVFASMGDCWSTGLGYSSAITAEGDLYCWGWNNYGQVGNGTKEDKLTPQKIMNLNTGGIYTSESGNTGGNLPFHLYTDVAPAILGSEITIHGALLLSDDRKEDFANPLTWTSSDPSIIDISDGTSAWENGMLTFTVTPKKAGAVTLTVSTINGITEDLKIIVEPELIKDETDYCLTQKKSVTVCSVVLPETDKEYLDKFMSSLVVDKKGFYGIDYTYDYEISDDGGSAKLIMEIDPTDSYEGDYAFEIKSPGGQAISFGVYCQTGNYYWSGGGITEEDIVFDRAENEFLAAFDNYLNKTQSVIKKEGSKTATSVDNLAEYLKKQYGAVVTDFPSDLPKGWDNYVYEALGEKIADIANAKMSDISYSTDAVSLGSNIVKSVYKDYKYINESMEYENGKVVVDLNIWAMYGAFSGQIVCRSAQDKSKYYTMGLSMTPAQTEKVLQQYANDLAKLGASAANSVYFALAEDLLGKSLKDFTADYIKKYLAKYEGKLAEIGLGGFVDFCSEGYDIYNNVNAFSKTLSNADASKIYGQLKRDKEALEAFNNSATDKNAKRAGKKVVSAAEKILVLWEEYLATGTVTSKGGVKGFIKNIFTCPVAISAYDSDGLQIGYVGDDDVWYDDSIYIEEIGDAKIIYTPFDEEVSFKIEGTGYGTLNCAFEEFDKDGDTIGRLNYYDILLSPDTEVSVELPSSDLIAEHSDMVLNVDGTPVYANECIPVKEYTDSNISVSLQVDNEAGGIVYGAGKYIIGNAVNLIALANKGYVFTGWYDEKDRLVSVSQNIEFAARENVNYSAHFEVLPDDITGPDKISLAQAEITLSQSNYYYDGNAKTPSVTVKLAGKTLISDVDYTVSYSNNIDIGMASVIVTGIGNYEGTERRNFTISDGEVPKEDISKAEVTLSQDNYIYDGRAKTPTVTVKLNGKTLTLDADYIVSYSDNTNVGTAVVTITGIGSYTRTVIKNFTITPNPEDIGGDTSKISIAGVVITLSQNHYAYDGWQKKPFVTVKLNGKTLKVNEDYLLIYHNNIDVGTAQAIIIGKGKYTGYKSIDYTIAESEKQPNFPIISCKKKVYKTAYGAKPFTINATSKSKLLFTSCKPEIVSVDKNTGQVTVKGTGIAGITIKAGRKTVSVLVKVSPKEASLKSVRASNGRRLTVKWAKDKMATGYQVQVCTAKNFKKSLKKKNLSGTSYTFTKLKAGKKYYVRVRSYKKCGMETLYGTWSKVKQSNKIKN